MTRETPMRVVVWAGLQEKFKRYVKAGLKLGIYDPEDFGMFFDFNSGDLRADCGIHRLALSKARDDFFSHVRETLQREFKLVDAHETRNYGKVTRALIMPYIGDSSHWPIFRVRISPYHANGCAILDLKYESQTPQELLQTDPMMPVVKRTYELVDVMGITDFFCRSINVPYLPLFSQTAGTTFRPENYATL